jgi:hypothetical protein
VLVLCKVGTVGWSAGGECVGGWGRVVTGRGCESKKKDWMRMGRNSSWEGEQ